MKVGSAIFTNPQRQRGRASIEMAIVETFALADEAVEFTWGTFSTCPISMEFEHDEIVLHEFFDTF